MELLITILVGLIISVILSVTFWIIGNNQKKKSGVQAEVAKQKAEIISSIEEATGDILKSKGTQRDISSDTPPKLRFPVWSKWAMWLAWIPFLAIVVFLAVQGLGNKTALTGSLPPPTVLPTQALAYAPSTTAALSTTSTTSLKYDFAVADPATGTAITSLDFSGSAVSGGTFTITKFVNITSTGNGPINTVTASLDPSGAVGILAPANQWTLSGIATLSNGTGSLPIRLTGPVNFFTTTLPPFTIDLTADVLVRHTLSGTSTIVVAPTTTTPRTTSPVNTSATTTSKPMSFASPPAMQIDIAKQYFATFGTSLGSFQIQLFANETPITVNNFVFLSQQGFYSGVIFHRIMKTFMIQTGDPLGTGMGGPGYKFADELPPKHKYDVGIVAMANSGPNTNGSQFFICTGSDASSLNNYPNYTQFGQVVQGIDVVQMIASVPVSASSTGEPSKPLNPPVINSVVISEITTPTPAFTSAIVSTTTTAVGPRAIPASHVGRTTCFMCHKNGIGPALPTSPSHSSFTDALATCQACHKGP